MSTVTPEIREYMRSLGKRGTGASKARTSKQASKAAKARWKKARKKPANITPNATPENPVK